MKIIKRDKHITQSITVYQATDGTEFTNKEECSSYEESAKGVMRARVAKLIVFDTRNTKEDAWSVLGGMDDHDIIAVKMHKYEDFNTVCQFFLLECPWYNSDDQEERKKIKLNIIEKAYNDNDAILFGFSTDDKDYYLINSCQNIIDKLNSIKV